MNNYVAMFGRGQPAGGGQEMGGGGQEMGMPDGRQAIWSRWPKEITSNQLLHWASNLKVLRL